MNRSCAAGFSDHPDTATAVGEVLGAVLERIDPHPGLAVLFVAGPKVDQLREIGHVVDSLLAPEILVASAVSGVFGGSEEVAMPAGISLLAAELDHCVPVRLLDDAPETLAAELRPVIVDRSVVLLLGSTGFSFGRLDRALQDWGIAAAAVGGGPLPGVGAQQLLLGEQLFESGAVGVIIPPGSTAVCPLGVSVWDDDGNEVPSFGPDELFGAHGLVVFGESQGSLLGGPTLDFDIVFECVGSALAGMSGSPYIFQPAEVAVSNPAVLRPPTTALVLRPTE